MSYNLAASMGRLTDLYLNPESISKSSGTNSENVSKAKEEFGDVFAKTYDSMQAMRTLSDGMRSRYEFDHKDDAKNSLQDQSSAMTFSKGSSRILDMLSEQITDSMNEKVNIAMNNALHNL
ncbi:MULTISPECIES: hypothetical protein [unclassified Butyrivibrio]|uniref:hypothetical protein n=1 Tax=unclassified Butyrivibrio TaxID=2639466 RepID=UPI00040C74C3|nr:MULTISPECIES: hypothetical protein [unclassified Butyrivibrio]